METKSYTWMSRWKLGSMVRLGSMGYNPLLNGVYWGYNPLTNLLLTSWDIQVYLPMVSNGIHCDIIYLHGWLM